MGGRPRSLRLLLGRVVVFLSIGFLVAVLSGRGDGAGAAAMATTVEGLKHPLLLGRGRSVGARIDLDLVYVSKRRVPNGADPIHNRSA
ncbi:hypothetical protein Taro_043507 [Colocasia esculenta]|uniref:Uncharacterized protein n=1 Tax=Colocasia esculenta TaxID=4460 RepID=A0A843WJL7_COLES|nr:hypothetical protein [Colocasia esculenta]